MLGSYRGLRCTMDDEDEAARRLTLEIERAKRWVGLEKARILGSDPSPPGERADGSENSEPGHGWRPRRSGGWPEASRELGRIALTDNEKGG